MAERSTAPENTLASPHPARRSRTSRLPDPLELRGQRLLLDEDGNRALTRTFRMNIVSGVIQGLALLTLLPLATALADPDAAGGLITWLAVLAALALVGAVLRYRESLTAYGVTLSLLRTTLSGIGGALARLPLGWFTAERPGMLSRLVTQGLMTIGQMMAHISGRIISGAACIVTIVLGSYLWDVRIGLTLTVAVPVAALLVGGARRLREREELMVHPTEGEVAARVVEFARCQGALRAAGQAGSYEPLIEACRVNDRARYRGMWLNVLAMLISGIAAQAVVVAMIVLAARAAMGGALGPIQTIAFIGISLRLAQVLDDAASLSLGMASLRAPMDQVREVMEAPVLPEPAGTAEAAASGTAAAGAEEAAVPSAPLDVTLEHVRFSYDRPDAAPAAAPSAEPAPDAARNWVLDDVSISVPAGTMTAIVGPSGSGKTTLLRLIARFWDVDEGAVRVDGQDLRDLGTAALMERVSMVFQDVYLFDDTLEANIRVGRPEASDAEVRRAAELAGVSEIAERLPGGWDAPVGEGGGALSGGERQRVSIARALLKQAPVVLLDEATSALDGAREREVVEAVSHLRQQATVIAVAHKLDTIQHADQIIVLDERGRVAERGTHAELYAADGAYRRFWEARKQASGWRLGA